MDRGPITAIKQTLSRSERTEKIRLGELLVERGLVKTEKIRDALENQSCTGRKLGRVLVESGDITDDQLAQTIAALYRRPFFDLKGVEPDPALAKRLPEAKARHHKGLILEERPATFLVGLVDPTDMFAHDEIARIVKREIEVVVVSELGLGQALDRAYRKTEQISGLAKELEFDLREALPSFTTASSSTDDSAVARLVSSIFEDAIRIGASDVHIEPQEHRLIVRFRVDGLMQSAMEADPKIASALALRLKILSELNISEKRLPQDGRFNLPVREHRVDVRLSTLPTQFGESMVMRILSTGGGPRKLDRLGMPEVILTRFRAAIESSSGLVLVTGPTGSGKTTTLYSALQELNRIDTKIITVEDPVEYRLPGINQVQINEKIDLSFGAVLRSVLRQDPDVILVGEMRDQETAQIGLRAAITGHIVFSTLHTRDAASTPLRLIDMGVPPVMVASALRSVIAQRLLRVNCTNCSELYQPSPQEMAWVDGVAGSLPATTTFMRGKGCNHCTKSGYAGRRGIYELLEMNASLATLANRGDSEGFIRSAHESMRGTTMQAHAVALACSGVSTIAEAMRVASVVGE